MFLSIGSQLKNLEKDNYSIIGFNIDDFVAINNDDNRYDTKFLFLNPALFYKLDNNNIILSDPFLKIVLFCHLNYLILKKYQMILIFIKILHIFLYLILLLLLLVIQ